MPSINTELGERALSKMQHEMDWKPLKARCMRMYPTWSSRQTERILHEYQRFIALKVATRDVYDTIVLAPILLDAMWKQHIVSTQQYYTDCQMLLQSNQMLHYNADAPLNLNKKVRAKRMELTKASLCMMFSGMSKLTGDAKGIWEYDEGDASACVMESMNSALSSMSLANETLEEKEDPDVESTPDMPLLGNSQDEDVTEMGDETVDMPPKPSPRKKDRQRQRSKPFVEDPAAMDDTIQQERLLYIYRSGKVSKLRVVYPHETIQHIKTKIQRKSGLTHQEQHLEWEGLALDDRRSLGHYGIPNYATLVLTRVKPLHHSQQPIDTSILHHQSQDRDIMCREEDETETGDTTMEERDHPERRSSSPMRRTSPKSPRPPKPPRHRPHLHHQLPYSPSTATEDDSYVVSPSHQHAVAHNPRRRQQSFLNKLQIRERDHHDDRHLPMNPSGSSDNYHHTHRRDDSYNENPHSSSRPRPKADPTLQIFINTIMGFTITLTAQASDTVHHLKEMIEEQEDIPFAKQILILEGVPLNDAQQLADYTASGNASLHILLRLQAGSTSVAGNNSVGGASSSMLIGSSTMATVPRKRNKLLVRATASPTADNTISAAEMMRPDWR